MSVAKDFINKKTKNMVTINKPFINLGQNSKVTTEKAKRNPQIGTCSPKVSTCLWNCSKMGITCTSGGRAFHKVGTIIEKGYFFILHPVFKQNPIWADLIISSGGLM